MSSFLPITFTVVINVMECLLVYKLLSCKLKLKKQPCLIIICFFIFFFIATALNFSPVNSNIRMLITFLVDIAIAFILSQSNIAQTLFWGSIYMVICTVSDALTFQLGILFTDYSAAELLYEEPVSYIMTLIYLFFCFLFVYLLCWRKKEELSFPWYIQVLFIILLVLGIIAVELLLDLFLKLPASFSAGQYILFYAVGMFLLLFFLSLLLMQVIGKLYTKNLNLVEENKQKQFEKQQYDLIISTNEMLRHWKHDLRNHISVLKAMSEQQNCVEIEDYLNAVDKDLMKSTWLIRTGNTVIDAVLSSKLPKIQQLQIQFTHTVFLPESNPLGSLEWTSLLGNLFDNAVEACENYIQGGRQGKNSLVQDFETKQAFILLEIKPYNQFLSISVSNSSDGKHQYDSGFKLLSVKKEIGHGIGLKRVKQIVESAEGFLEIRPEKDSFHVSIVIPLNTKTDGGEME